MKWNASLREPRGRLSAHDHHEYSETKALLIGHSFVSRLRNTLVAKNTRRIINWPAALNVEEANIQPFIYGIPGAKIGDMHKFYEWPGDVRPECVIVDIGSNDVSSRRSAHSLVAELIAELQAMLDSMNGVISITWCHIVPRSKQTNGMSVLQYRRKSNMMNRLMARETGKHENIHHWKHQGLTRASQQDLLKDGVHLNRHSMWKYQKSCSRLLKWSKMNIV